jgi:hypothetical protein
MRIVATLALLIVALSALATTTAMPPLTKAGFVGTWEAMVQDQSMAVGVYQMLVPREGDAKLIQLSFGGKSMFFGRASSWELADGHIRIRFVVDPAHIDYYDWIEIEGSAVGEHEGGAIVGNLTKHRKPSGTGLDQWSENVQFMKGRWAQYLDAASKEAEKILRDATIDDGHAVPRKP